MSLPRSNQNPNSKRSLSELDGADRREFIRTAAIVTTGAASALILPSHLRANGRFADFAKTEESKPESLVTQLYKSLDEKQRAKICFGFDDQLREKVDNNWHITDASIDSLLNKDQQQLVREIFMGLHSEEYAQTVFDQVEHDNSGDGGFNSCAIALFGEPGTGKFEFVFTGRHVTRRCDGDSVAGAAFGGPIFYGHSASDFNEKPDHPGNAYWFQAKRANELFQALDGKQRALALFDESRGEHGTDTVKLSRKTESLKGLPASELSADQMKLARQVMTDLLAPFRQADREESMKLVEAGGFDQLRFSYYKNEDVGNDQVWDTWQVEGPSMVWYFRGDPHVHTWVHIRDPKA
jgi:Protein of unknown function (DUF3500)